MTHRSEDSERETEDMLAQNHIISGQSEKMGNTASSFDQEKDSVVPSIFQFGPGSWQGLANYLAPWNRA